MMPVRPMVITVSRTPDLFRGLSVLAFIMGRWDKLTRIVCLVIRGALELVFVLLQRDPNQLTPCAHACFGKELLQRRFH